MGWSGLNPRAGGERPRLVFWNENARFLQVVVRVHVGFALRLIFLAFSFLARDIAEALSEARRGEGQKKRHHDAGHEYRPSSQCPLHHCR
jgi:hypothetical protein